MLVGRDGLLSYGFAFSAIFFLLVVIFAVCALAGVDKWINVMILVIIMIVGIFGIFPYVFEEE